MIHKIRVAVAPCQLTRAIGGYVLTYHQIGRWRYTEPRGVVATALTPILWGLVSLRCAPTAQPALPDAGEGSRPAVYDTFPNRPLGKTKWSCVTAAISVVGAKV